MPSFEEIACEQNYPGDLGSSDWASAGIVNYGGTERIIICGGYHDTGCQVLTGQGWEISNPTFQRYLFVMSHYSMCKVFELTEMLS